MDLFSRFLPFKSTKQTKKKKNDRYDPKCSCARGNVSVGKVSKELMSKGCVTAPNPS
jgi:hypothetical protein